MGKPKNNKPECGKCAYRIYDCNLGWFCSYLLNTGKIRGEDPGETCSHKYDILLRASKDEFKSWPESVKKGYLEHLYSEFGVSNAKVGEIFDVSASAITKWNQSLGIKRPTKSKEKIEAWNEFLSRDSYAFENNFTNFEVW